MAVEAAASVANQPSTALGKARLAQNFETFLSLLTTQLKNQDPLSPLDSNQFTEQLTQMTGVEQQLLTNELLQKLIDGQSSGVADAVSLIGKHVRAVGDQAALSKGKAEWTYKLDAAAANVKLEVLDSTGRVVFVGSPTENGAGEHVFKWDGKNSAGANQPDGVYRLRVTAVDSGNKPVNAITFVQGLVTAVEQSDGQTLINVGGVKVPWDTVSSVRLAATDAATPATSDETAEDATDNTAANTGDGPDVTFREDGSMVSPFDDE